MVFMSIGAKKSKYGRRSRLSKLPRTMARYSIRPPRNSRQVPKTLQVPRNSKGNRYWPRLGSSPVPMYKTARLCYTSDPITLSTTTGGVVGITHAFGLNCCYDPDITGVGHQPMGYDQWAAFYRVYKVHRVDVKIRPMYFSTDRMFIAAQVTSSQDATALAGATYSACNERANVATKIMETNGMDDDCIIYGSFTISEIEGQHINNDNYGSVVSGNPGNIPKLTLGVGQIDNSDTGSLKVVVELVFHTSFYNKLTLGQS